MATTMLVCCGIISRKRSDKAECRHDRILQALLYVIRKERLITANWDKAWFSKLCCIIKSTPLTSQRGGYRQAEAQ